MATTAGFVLIDFLGRNCQMRNFEILFLIPHSAFAIPHYFAYSTYLLSRTTVTLI
jgi:hypothetical protein